MKKVTLTMTVNGSHYCHPFKTFAEALRLTMQLSMFCILEHVTISSRKEVAL